MVRNHPGSLPLPCYYYVAIPERFEHTEIHLRLKKLVAKDGGIVIVDRGGGARTSTVKDSLEWD